MNRPDSTGKRKKVFGVLPSGKGCRVTAVDKRPLPMETRCGASVCTRNARPASRTSRPAVAMPASKGIHVEKLIMHPDPVRVFAIL